MKNKFILIISVILMTLLLFGCAGKINQTNNRQMEQHVVQQSQKQNESIEEPTTEPSREPTPEPTEEPTPSPTPEPEIDYDALFDFSDWESGLNESDRKETFMDNYWKEKAMEVFNDAELYELIKTNKRAKEAFINEIKTQLSLQIQQYLASSKIPIDDSMMQLINDMIDIQIQDLEDAIH